MPTETEQEFNDRLAAKAEAVKKDMKAGRYRHGQLRPEIKHKTDSDVHQIMKKYQSLIDYCMKDIYYSKIEKRMYDHLMYGSPRSGKSMSVKELYGKRYDSLILDESQYIKSRFVDQLPKTPEPEEKDWEKTRFKSGPETTPSKDKRAKLRAKRKKK